MKINKIISNPTLNYNRALCAKNTTNFSNPQDNKTDIIAFKGDIAIISRLGIQSISDCRYIWKKKAFLNSLAERTYSPDTSNYAQKASITLFELAKSPAKDIKSVFIGSTKKIKKRLETIRSFALETLFPKIPEIVNDANYGHTAKLALLESMIETGEYVKSTTFYQVFKNLPLALYEDDKVFLMKKILNNINVFENARNNLRSKDAQAVNNANVALLMTLTPQSQMRLIKEDNSINLRVASAFKSIKDGFTKKFGGFKEAYNKAFGLVEFYKGALLYEDVLYLSASDINRYAKTYNNNKATLYDPILSRTYVLEVLETYKDNKQAIMNEFNIDEDMCNQLLSDYEHIKCRQHHPGNLQKDFDEKNCTLEFLMGQEDVIYDRIGLHHRYELSEWQQSLMEYCAAGGGT